MYIHITWFLFSATDKIRRVTKDSRTQYRLVIYDGCNKFVSNKNHFKFYTIAFSLSERADKWSCSTRDGMGIFFFLLLLSLKDSFVFFFFIKQDEFTSFSIYHATTYNDSFTRCDPLVVDVVVAAAQEYFRI